MTLFNKRLNFDFIEVVVVTGIELLCTQLFKILQ